MPVQDETLIAIVPGNYVFALENTELSNTALFQWTDGTVKNAYGASSSLGQAIVQINCSGWNASSESGNPLQGTPRRFMY